MRTSALIFLLVVMVLSCAACISPQERSWKELQSKVGMLYQQGRYAEGAKVAEEALTVAEKTFGPNHPRVATSLNNLAKLYRKIGKEDEAERLEARARKIRSKR